MGTRVKIPKQCLYALSALAIAYLLILLFLYSYQRHLIFKPSGMLRPPAAYGLVDMEAIKLTTKDGLRLLAWYHPPASPKMPVLVYFHGNAGNLGARATKLGLFSRQMGVLAVSYRGYGGSEGEPSEAGLYEDARTAIAYLLHEGIAESRLVFYGESLGTGVAVQMATEYHPAAVVLEAPYSSLVSLGERQYPYIPVSALMKDRFNSLEKIAHITAPLLIFHGEEDATIPINQARTLLAYAQVPKQGVFFPKTHHSDFNLETITSLAIAFAQPLAGRK